MTGVRLGAVAVDCSDPAALAEFYKGVLSFEVVMSSPDLVVLKGSDAEVFLTFERIRDHRRPTWPAGPVPKQMHLDLAVSDLDVEETRILGLGATKADVQPDPDKWRVLIDPEGHPFCITVLF
jgi:catechol-2,3-dioxygenase